MKKFFLFVYLMSMVAFLGYSQSLTLSNQNGPVANNSYISVLGLPTDDEIIAEMDINNITSDSIPVMLKKVELSMMPGTASLFCWGLCFSPTVFVSPNPLTIFAHSTDSLNFSGHYLPQGVPGMSVIRYVFYDERNPSDSVCFNVNFHAYPLGVQDPSKTALLSAYPNPASGNVTITYTATQAGSIVIRNLLGEIVTEIGVDGASGKVVFDAGELNSGIYFYSLVTGGDAVATKKLIVRH